MAWRRVKWDLRNRAFVRYAFEEEVLDEAADEWFDKLRAEDDGAPYSGHACEVCEVPKTGFQIRPGARLGLDDHLVYSALVQEMYPHVREYFTSWPRPKDYAYMLQGRDDVPWFQPTYVCWTRFRNASQEKLAEGCQVVLTADIAGYYENIDLSRLRYNLRNLGVSDDLLGSLFACLNKWAEPRGRGIPQGISASDLLAKLYLDPLDRRLERERFNHIRYVDDIRVFCGSHLEAKRALAKLSAELRTQRRPD